MKANVVVLFHIVLLFLNPTTAFAEEDLLPLAYANGPYYGIPGYPVAFNANVHLILMAKLSNTSGASTETVCTVQEWKEEKSGLSPSL
jgi:hypothetical protein